MASLFNKIHILRSNPQIFNGKVIQGPYWPDPVEILSIISQDDSFVFISRTLKEDNIVSQKMFFPDQLKDIMLVDQDFKGNALLFFLSMMGHIIRNNYQSDPFFAVGISNIEPLPHQLDAVYNHILPRGRLRFMIADDPGAGKTIMAGLVIKEYIYRGLAKRILIICPGGLAEQWSDELKTRFGEIFVLIDRAFFNAYKHRNVWKEHDRVIVSIDFTKQDEILKTLDGIDWDLIIVDEAHKFAGRINKEIFQPNLRYRLGKTTCSHAFNVLFLTATPHKGDDQVFRMLLALLEPDIFGDEHIYYAPDVNEQVLELEKGGIPIFIRRLKESMFRLNKQPLFKKRRSDTITWTISDLETEIYRAVSKYVKENFNKALKDKKTTVAFALKIMQRRLLSSSHAIYNTLGNRAGRLQAILDNDEFKISEKELNRMEREYRIKLQVEWDDLSERDRMRLENKLLQVSMAKNPEELKEEITLLRELQSLAGKLKDSPDKETKLLELKKLLEKHLRNPEEKILIFTEFTDTLYFLQENIEMKWNYSVSTIHGKMGMEERKKARKKFQADTQVLLATEAAGEGINLQFCNLLINYDIPWTPTRLEQRLGRIHRIGQKKDCYFLNLVSDTAADGKPIAEGEVLATLLRKIETIRKSLGTDRVFDMIGEKIFGDLSLDNVFEKIQKDPSGFFEIKDRIESDELEKQIKNAIEKARANMTVNIDEINETNLRSEDTRLWPEYIENYVRIALDVYGGKITGTNTVQVPKEVQDFSAEIESKYNDITFTKPESSSIEESNVNYITLGHPLLDGFIDLSLERSGIDLRRGAVFVDQTNFGTGLLWFLEQSVEDGNNRMVGKTIGLVYQPLNEKMVPLEPEILPVLKLWDFEPLQHQLDVKLNINPQQYQNNIVNFFHNNHGKQFFNRIKKSNDRFMKIQSSAVKKAYDHQRGYLVSLIARLRGQFKKTSIDDKKFDKIDKKINRSKNRRDILQKRYSTLQEELNRRGTITPKPAQILGLALVIPGDLSGDYDKAFILDEKKREKKLRELTNTKIIENAAMKFVFKWEKDHGRITTNVSNINCGYDIESRDPRDPKNIRRIEVKGHTTSDDTFITDNEFKMGLRHGNSFWLYIVENALTKPRLRTIQNPALVLFDKVKEIRSKKYIIPKEVIEKYSEIIENP